MHYHRWSLFAITCQLYYTNAAYSLFNIYYGLVLSLFAVISLHRRSPGDHAVTALGLRYIHCCFFITVLCYYCWSLQIFTFINIVHYDYFMLLFIVVSFVHHDCVESLSGSFAMTTAVLQKFDSQTYWSLDRARPLWLVPPLPP